ncbi:metal ABC transporter ATP-binding protein [Candidatus Uhrbacteria bacterium]|nr:metal ABC transporter ATP-binding protein [Candidatus Uhrbacteria bacterium]
MKRPPLIRFEDVRFGFAGRPVLENISFTIEAGEYVGIIGPNGGGKTTLLRLILGEVVPDAGRVLILGEPAATYRDKASIGYVPQHAAARASAFPATVAEIVASGRTPRLGLFRRPSKRDRTAVENALDLSGLKDLRDRLMRELSGGQRQRALIARALAAEARVLLLDEPFEGVDVDAQRDFYALLRRLNAKGITILFVTHDVDIIEKEAGDIICLNRHMVCPDGMHAGSGRPPSSRRTKHFHSHDA